MFLLAGAAGAMTIAASALARQFWPFRRPVSMLLVGQFILGAVALVLCASNGKAVHVVATVCLCGAGLCLGGHIVRELPTWSARRPRWRVLRRGRRQTSYVHVWADALGAGLIASTFPWADGHKAAVAVLAFLFGGVGPGVVQSIRVSNRKCELP